MDIRELIKNWMAWKVRKEGKSYPFKTLAEDAEISPTYLSNIMTGTRNPGSKTLAKIAGAFNISMSDFYAGPPASLTSDSKNHLHIQGNEKKEFHIDNESESVTIDDNTENETYAHTKNVLKIFKTSNYELDRLSRILGYNTVDLFVAPPENSFPKIDSQDPLSTDDRSDEDETSPTIPLFNECPQGHWSEWNISSSGKEYNFDSIPRFFGVKGKHVFAIRLQDDSMVPDLNEGDLLIINPELEFTNTNGGIGVVINNDCFQIRRIHLSEDKYTLIPSNTRYQPENIPSEGTFIYKIVLWIPDAKNAF